ncbi:MAG: hypothetical protein ACYC1T_00155 [Sulfuricaulis sp.]
MRNHLRNVIMIVPIVAMFSGPAGADTPIRVLVYGEHQGDNLIYHYTVINNGTEGFNNFTIGSEYDPDDKQTWPELGKLPVGWRYGEKGEIGTEILLDPTSTTQPAGWAPWVYGKQDIDFFYLNWNGGTNGVEPGQTLSGFSVTVPKGKDQNLLPMPADAELKYLNGHFTVGLPGYKGLKDIHGALERQDITPPSLNVTATPANLWPPNGKPVSITVNLSVRDDYDPVPEVKLESITANESLAEGDIADATVDADDRQLKLVAKRTGNNKEGRIYTITYSATDASGNKSTASTTVTVPHDQRK